MDMTKFCELDDPGFVAITGEVRRWVRALVASIDNTNSIRESNQDLSVYHSSLEAGGAPGSQLLRITPVGSHNTGVTTINVEPLFQGR
jgi:hypothetical protein